MKTKHVRKVFDIFGTKVVETARGILNAKGKNSSGKLSSSLGYSLKVKEGRLDLRFLGAPYASIVDEGIKGSKSSAKAPKSRFSYTSKQPPSGVIDKWVVRKGLRKARDSQGRFIPRKSLVFLIARSIKLFGIRPSNFFSDAINQGLRGLPRKFADAYARDAAQFIRTVTQEL
tara:strand:+ start:3330 stop:3848 length:519 start_codon:yes stop_codon:yes gene_type:complete